MSRTTITQTGAIVYRTKTMELSLAAAFARCIEGNSGRFTSVEIVEARTKEEAYFVTFRPVSTERQGMLYQEQFNIRQQRAEDEGQDYIYWKDEHPGSWWVFNPKSGETYQVGVFSCTCADYHYRASKIGVPCKHMHALKVQSDAGMLGATDKKTPTYADVVDGRVVRRNLLTGAIVEESVEERRARMQSSVNRDF
jgi:predicted nucleic acid-binding Zn finger protein